MTGTLALLDTLEIFSRSRGEVRLRKGRFGQDGDGFLLQLSGLQ